MFILDIAIIMSTCHILCRHAISYVDMSYLMSTCHILCRHVISYVDMSYLMSTCQIQTLKVYINTCRQNDMTCRHN